MKQTTVGIQQKITFVILLFHRRISYDFRCRKTKILLSHSFGKLKAFVFLHAVGSHVDEFDPFGGDTEYVIRHFQVHTS